MMTVPAPAPPLADSQSNGDLVVVDQLVKRYPKLPFNAVDGVSFSVRPGEVFGLLGPNGAGGRFDTKYLYRVKTRSHHFRRSTAQWRVRRSTTAAQPAPLVPGAGEGVRGTPPPRYWPHPTGSTTYVERVEPAGSSANVPDHHAGSAIGEPIRA